MNLHEECLLKYLTHSVNLANTTDVLLRCNRLIEKKFDLKRVAKPSPQNYTYNQ